MTEIAKKDENALSANRPLDLQTETRDILLLHFKQGMSYGSVASIFSRATDEVEQICSNFAASFSRREYMMNVVEAMSKMNRDRKAPSSSGITSDAKDAEIAELRRKLTEAELRAELYQEMVRVAEATYQIPIRKKFGAK